MAMSLLSVGSRERSRRRRLADGADTVLAAAQVWQLVSAFRRAGQAVRPSPPPSRRLTKAFGTVAVGTTLAVLGSEFATVWRRGHAPTPSQTEDVLGAGVEAAIETVEVAVEGYKTGSPREIALLNLLLSFSGTFGLVRLSTHRIRSHGRFLVFRDMVINDGKQHIHHFVPGIVLAFLAGGASIVSREEEWDKYLAVPFGVGAAMTLDESALLLQLDDVYWTEDGVISVQVTLAAMALLSLLALAMRLLRRGEHEVLDAPSPPLLGPGPATGGAPETPADDGAEPVESAG